MKNKHHKYSPSSLDRLYDCPGSFDMSLGLEDEESKESKEGDLLHYSVSTGDITNLDNDQKIKVDRCNEFIGEIIKEYNLVHYDIKREEKVRIINDDFKVLTEGTADIIIVSKEIDFIIIIDWKFGGDKVIAKDNNQLRAYSIGAMQKYNKQKSIAYIFQPTINNISKETFYIQDITIDNIISNVEREGLFLYPTERACKYCKAKLKCPAFGKQFQVMTQEHMQLQNLSDSNLVELFEKSEIVKKYCGQIKKELMKRISVNEKCGEYYIKIGKGNREITEINKCYSLLKDYLTDEEFVNHCKLKVADLEKTMIEKIYSTSTEKITKKSSKEKFNEILKDLIIRTKGKQNLIKLEA